MTDDRRAMQWALLGAHIRAALSEQKDQDTASRIAATILEDGFVVMAEFRPDDQGQPDPTTLCYVVRVVVADGGTAPLVSVHYTRLGVTDAEAEMELLTTLAQLGVSVVPDDASGLDGAT